MGGLFKIKLNILASFHIIKKNTKYFTHAHPHHILPSAMYIRNYLVKIFKWLSANCAKQLCTSSIFFQLNFPGCCLQYRIFHLSHRQPRCFRASFTLYSLTVNCYLLPLPPQASSYYVPVYYTNVTTKN